MAQWVRSLDLTTHTSLSPIRHGFKPCFVNYKNGHTRLAVACDKVYQLLAHAYGRWFSLDTPASSTTKTGRHDIAEILLKVVLKHKKSINQSNHWDTSTTHKTSEHERGTIKLWMAELLNLSDYRAVGTSNRRTIELGLSDYQTVGLSNRRTIESSDYRSVPVMPTPLFLYARNFFICEIEVKFHCKK
jgi:hypothetical protein